MTYYRGVSKIKLDVSNWKISVDDRTRGRMKVTFKLNKDEAEGFKNWSTHIKPENITMEDFSKQIFFNGIEYLNLKLQDVAKKIIEDEKLRTQLEASGFNISELEKNLNQ
jgi:hypothetical protein